jgi:hypothetical protein
MFVGDYNRLPPFMLAPFLASPYARLDPIIPQTPFTNMAEK